MYIKSIHFGLLILLSLLASCQSIQPQFEQESVKNTSQKQDEINPEIATVISSLSSKPGWLFPIAKCPGKVMSNYEKPIRHFAQDCAANPEKCLTDCSIKNGSACYGLALLLQEQKQETMSLYSEALFSRSCELGITSGCTNRAAGMLNLEDNSDSDLECIAQTFAKTCAKDDAWGCTMSGLVLSQGIGCDRDIDKALKILPKACSNDPNDPACEFAKSIQKQILDTR